MSFIQVAYTDDRNYGRWTTGKVNLTADRQEFKLYNSDIKKQTQYHELEALVPKLERVGKYKFVVHTFLYDTVVPDSHDIKFRLIHLNVGMDRSNL